MQTEESMWYYIWCFFPSKYDVFSVLQLIWLGVAKPNTYSDLKTDLKLKIKLLVAMTCEEMADLASWQRCDMSLSII